MEGPRRRRKLHLFDATMLVMGGIVGVGIFFTPQSVAALIPSPVPFLCTWVLGAGVALCGAATFAELGGTFPRSGGWFEFLREIFGPFVAFLFAWMILGVVATGAMAIIADFGASQLLGLVWADPGPRIVLAVAAAILLALTGIMLAGIKVGATVQNVLMVTKLTAVGALVVGGLAFFTPGGEIPPVEAAVAAAPLWRGMIPAFLPVLFAFGGWQHVCYVADDVADPRRTVPRAILFGVVAVGVIYLLLNLAFLRVLGMHGLASTDGFAAEVALRTFGSRGARALQAAMGVSAIGVCAVNVIVTPGIFVAMARSRLFFAGFGRLHPKTGAPVLALLTQAALALSYLLWMRADAFRATLPEDRMDPDALLGSVVFAEWLFHGLIAFGLIHLRLRRPDLPRPFRSWAFPAAPLLYLLVAIVVVLGNLWTAPGIHTTVGVGVLTAGAAIYLPWRRWMARRP